MNPFDTLSTLAEIAIALAGFSSVIVVFRREGAAGTWRPEDAFRFRSMLRYSLIAGLLAIAPLLVASFGVADAALWPRMNVASAAALSVNTAVTLRGFRNVERGALNLRLFAFLIGGEVSVGGLQALSGFGFGPPGAGAYLFGAGWFTFVAGLMFYRLVTAPIESAR